MFLPRLKGPIDRSWELHPKAGTGLHAMGTRITKQRGGNEAADSRPQPETWTWLVCSELKNPALDSAKRPRFNPSLASNYQLEKS